MERIKSEVEIQKIGLINHSTLHTSLYYFTWSHLLTEQICENHPKRYRSFWLPVRNLAVSNWKLTLARWLSSKIRKRNLFTISPEIKHSWGNNFLNGLLQNAGWLSSSELTQLNTAWNCSISMWQRVENLCRHLKEHKSICWLAYSFPQNTWKSTLLRSKTSSMWVDTMFLQRN